MLSRFFKTKTALRPAVSLHVTLWPSFPHFEEFANDDRLGGIRLNSAMMAGAELDSELDLVKKNNYSVPLWFDIKGRQLRVRKVYPYKTHLELDLNHKIDVECPTQVLFKAGADSARLLRVEDGTHLVFEGGPHFMVKAGESLHIRHPSLVVHEPIFCDYEVEKIEKVVKAGFTKYYLSYVEDEAEVTQLREFIGPDAELILKIETKAGMEYALNRWKKTPNTSLMAARGDLFVELDKPHEILRSVKALVAKDPNCYVGSRFLLSVINSPVPECDDLSDLAWVYEIGCNNFLLCDELCLKGNLLGRAVNVFDAFRKDYK
jgi:pyruvate kinase